VYEYFNGYGALLTVFIDEARIYVKAGSGGDGCNSIYTDKYDRKGSPDGGPGGAGGDVVFLVDENVQTLMDFQYRQHHEAERGYHGSSTHKKGARGKDLIIKVPPGTVVRDAGNDLIIRDLVNIGDRVIVARGGAGGKGSSRHREATKGSPGQISTVRLELKLIADAGIIGYPNAGKSTFISKISHAHPKIASYPFTTKEPVLGVARVHEDASLVVAEIPGLIEGAHKGRGLGDKFLRHIERTRILIHLVDISAFEGRDPIQDYRKLNFELKAYSKELSKKFQFIALNKIDNPDANIHIKAFRKAFPKKTIYPISAITGEGVKKLLEAVYKKAMSLRAHAKK